MPQSNSPTNGAAPPAAAPAGSAAASPALARLRAIRRLTVGPVYLEPQRLTAAYVVEQGGDTDTFELAYRYEQDVFDPDDPVDQNLATMIAAQVALNYGLFCDEIVIAGPLDTIDQRFLADMAENTACEIYVNKLLSPNPFLIGDAVGLPIARLERYCAAALRFDAPAEPTPGARNARATAWPRGDDAYLVLSSGGKDSLVSYGLLREAGGDVHPVFVNESGRHWFTALNAYRYFSEHVPNTSRVWMNADRLYNWMLRKFPFIRPDFADLRSDGYPIRLWTVAVFLFGALPIARRRGLGRVIIGDEFDTTEVSNFHGITHYNGLFDQSRHFDEALSRYYSAKGWGLTQYSIVRPLSELLIEKILAERYPELLRLQVSCHATHMEGEFVRPCGKCEKCRRIVGMLTALGHDPGACGYTSEQIKACLADITRGGLHQEPQAVEHLAFLLKARDLLEGDAIGGYPAQARPHIMQLRFDREHSPVNGIPAELRTRLYPLMASHAEGAVKKQGKVWSKCDPLSPELLARAYPFGRRGASATGVTAPGVSATGAEAPPAASGNAPLPAAAPADGQGPPQDFVLGELTWPQAEARLKTVDVALLPVGAIEQHGPHLPLDTDAFDAEYLAVEVAKACSEPRPFVLPLIAYGVSYHHEDFRGTISVSNETLSRFVYEIGMNMARNGITKLIIINGHGGNAATLNFAAQMINRDAHIFTCVDTGETSDADIESIAETAADIHAGEIETSTSLYTRPHLVNMKKARKSVPKFSSRYLDFSSKHSVEWYARTAKISPSGVMGDPSRATREKGARIWAIMVRNLVELVEHVKCMSLDEIHQRNRF